MKKNNVYTKWHNEIALFSQIKPILILEGNVLDTYQYPVTNEIFNINQYLYKFYQEMGYQNIVFYDNLDGFYNDLDDENIERFAKIINRPVCVRNNEKVIEANFRDNSVSDAVRLAITQNKEATVIIMGQASRYIISPTQVMLDDVNAFASIIKSSMNAKEVTVNDEKLKNLVIFVVNKVNDIPSWFYLDNPNVKTIVIETPSMEERENFVKGVNFKTFFNKQVQQEIATLDESQIEKIQNKFVGQTDKMRFTDLNALRKLSKIESEHVLDLTKVVDLFKFGIKENPWSKIDYEEFVNAEQDISRRVLGQKNAVKKVTDIVKRAIAGMSGLQHSSSSSKPKGILFFAGPTGTGKTETAKALAEKIFGDETAVIRFDMSEYQQPHSDQKLLGAPPGYVGYDAGGQLTNAIKNNPFSIVLFDEIEKAHPSILDKFLQILEDGRLTDGQGNTVYFSESIIVFTSNLGMIDPITGKALTSINNTYAENKEIVKKQIQYHFRNKLNRPEILNRIGMDNIVVFDYIGQEVAKDILKLQVNKVVNNFKLEKQITLTLSDSAFNTLYEKATHNLEDGGRGIGNAVETYLINPLSNYVFDTYKENKTNVHIKEIHVISEDDVKLICE